MVKMQKLVPFALDSRHWWQVPSGSAGIEFRTPEVCFPPSELWRQLRFLNSSQPIRPHLRIIVIPATDIKIQIPKTLRGLQDNIKDTKDNKSVLQEFLQRSIEYRLESESGPAHNKTFICSAVVDNIVYGVGEGKTKKAAEQEAAKQALKILAGK